MEDQDSILQDFLVECSEGLNRLDQDFVTLEREPSSKGLVAGIFRTIHTIKGTCGFLGLPKLEAVAHATESVLSQMRDGKMPITADRITVLLEAVDIIKEIMASLETTKTEPDKNYDAVQQKLNAVLKGEAPSEAEAPKTTPSVPAQDRPAPASAEAAPAGATAEKGLPAARLPDGQGQAGPSAADSTIRVDVRLLDKLMNLVGELVLARNQLLQRVREQDDSADTGTAQRMNHITTELQDAVMKTRMQPIRNVYEKFPRLVRDLSRTAGKDVELVMEGAETELDRTLLEAIKDPLTHIVRNAVDHGIETPAARAEKGKPVKGTLFLKAFHEGGQIVIEILDDGGGINLDQVKRKAVEKGLISADAAGRMSEREAIDLIFLPGLSTAEKVTNVSGRGVGMDVVRTNIEKIGGMVEVMNRAGGTTLRIKIPLTLAIIPALMVKAGGELFAIPQANLLELVRVDEESGGQIEMIHKTEFYRLRGTLLPLVRMCRVLRLSENRIDGGSDGGLPAGQAGTNIVVLSAGEKAFGLVLDEVIDSEEIVVKPLGRQLKGLSVFAGATIMGDGHVALILDVSGIAKEGGLFHATTKEAEAAGAVEERLEAIAGAERQSLLIFSISGRDRFAVPLALVARLEEFDPKRIESSSGGEVIQYRDALLSLVPLGRVLGLDAPPRNGAPAPVIVFSDGERSIGLVVGQIIDIVEEKIVVHHASSEKPGVGGSLVIQGKTTDLLDIYRIIEMGAPGWLKRKPREAQKRKGRILLVEDSAFFRGMLRPHLEMEGYQVIEASDGEEALRLLSQKPVDLVLSDIEMPKMDGVELARRIRSEARWSGLPMAALTAMASDADRTRGEEAGFSEYLIKFDREAVLSAMERLLSVTRERGD